MHELKYFATIIEELLLILRESKYTITNKRYYSTNIKQDNTLA